MLAPGVVAEIRGLLVGGELSQGEIARRWGVSRGTVNAIATGRRAARPSRSSHGEEPAFMRGPARRCPGCGGLVQMPCLACRLRAMQRDGRAKRAREIPASGTVSNAFSVASPLMMGTQDVQDRR